MKPAGQISHILGRSGVRYCVLHGWQSLPEYLPSDLDIVVRPEDLNILEGTLRKEEEGQLVQSFEYEASSFFFVLCVRDGDRKCFVQLDAAPDYRRNGHIFFTAEELLAGKRQWNGFWVASPSTEFAYLLVKKVLKAQMPAHQKKRIGQLCHDLGNEGLRIVHSLFGQKFGDSVISWIHSGEWNIFETHLLSLKRALVRQVNRRDPLNSVRFWIAECRRMLRRYWHPTGLLVAVLGPDGVGKTTLIECLRESLAGAFRQTQLFHLRPCIFGPKGTNGPVTDPHGKPPHPWWLSLLKLPYYILDYGLGYLSKVRPRLVRSTLVLFDRYYHDLLVDPRRYRYGGPIGFARLVRVFIPKPDLFLILDAPEELLLVRKQEVSPQEMRRQREAYRRLATEIPNAVFLDTSLCPKEVALDASEAILEHLRRRYLTRRHLWFRDNAAETLKWLQSVLFSSENSRLAVSSAVQNGATRQWETNGSFRWLAFNDGRGYLIPIGSKLTMMNGLCLYNAQNLKAKVAKKLLATSLNAGLGWPLLRKVQILIRQNMSKEERSKISLLEHLKDVLGRQDLTFAISLGTPGVHRKPVIQIMTPDGKILGYVKVGWNQHTNALARNESHVCRHLSAFSFDSFAIPNVIYAGSWGDRFVCIQSAMEGKIQTAPRKLTSQYFAVLKELATVHSQSIFLKDSALWTRLLKRIESTQSAYYRHMLRQGANKVQERLGNNRLPFHLCHGDFAPWNAQLVNGRLILFDWEYADLEAPAAWDLFHFSVQKMRLLERRRPIEIHKAVINGVVENHSIRTHLESVNIKEDILRPLFLLYLLDRLAFCISQENAAFHKLQFFATQVNLCLES